MSSKLRTYVLTRFRSVRGPPQADAEAPHLSLSLPFAPRAQSSNRLGPVVPRVGGRCPRRHRTSGAWDRGPRAAVLPAGLLAQQRPLAAERGAGPGVRRAVPPYLGYLALDRGHGLLVVLPEFLRREHGDGPRLRRGTEHRGRLDRTLGGLLRPRLVAGGVSVDGATPPGPRARPETGAGRAADRRAAGPSRPPEAARARGETGEPEARHQGRRTADADAVSGRTDPLRRGPGPLSRRAEGGRGEAEGARRGTGRGAILTGGRLQYKLVIAARSDLELSRGKLAVQVAHASVMAAFDAKARRRKWFAEWWGG